MLPNRFPKLFQFTFLLALLHRFFKTMLNEMGCGGGKGRWKGRRYLMGKEKI